MEYFAWSNRSSCGLAHDFGGKILGNPPGKDGQKVVCIDPQVAPQARNCLVYSFGISNEWSFDEEMEEYGCQVFAFDPSMNVEPHDHTPGIHFYNWGLSDRDEIEIHDNGTEWQMYSLSSVYDKLSERHGPTVIDYLKIDIGTLYAIGIRYTVHRQFHASSIVESAGGIRNGMVQHSTRRVCTGT
jgi:hypothetical protein